MARSRRRGIQILAPRFLLLRGWSGVGYKVANSHRLSSDHLVTRVKFGSQGVNSFNLYWLSYLSRGFGFNEGFRLNRHVYSAVLGYKLS